MRPGKNQRARRGREPIGSRPPIVVIHHGHTPRAQRVPGLDQRALERGVQEMRCSRRCGCRRHRRGRLQVRRHRQATCRWLAPTPAASCRRYRTETGSPASCPVSPTSESAPVPANARELELIRIGAGIDRRQRRPAGCWPASASTSEPESWTGAQEVGVDAVIRGARARYWCRPSHSSPMHPSPIRRDRWPRPRSPGPAIDRYRHRAQRGSMARSCRRPRAGCCSPAHHLPAVRRAGVPASKPPPPTAPVKTLSPRPSTTFPTTPLLVTLSTSPRTASISVPASLPAPLSTSPTLPPPATVSTAWPAADTTGSIRLEAESPIRNGRGDSVGRTKDAIEPVSTEPIAAQAAAEDVIEIVDAQAIEQTAGVDDVLQRTAAAERADRLITSDTVSDSPSVVSPSVRSPNATGVTPAPLSAPDRRSSPRRHPSHHRMRPLNPIHRHRLHPNRRRRRYRGRASPRAGSAGRRVIRAGGCHQPDSRSDYLDRRLSRRLPSDRSGRQTYHFRKRPGGRLRQVRHCEWWAGYSSLPCRSPTVLAPSSASDLAINRCGMRTVPTRSDLFQRIGSILDFCLRNLL